MILFNTKTGIAEANLDHGSWSAAKIDKNGTQDFLGLSSEQLAKIPYAQWVALTTDQMSNLTGACISALAKHDSDKLSKLINPTESTGWSSNQFSALNLAALEAIPPKLLAQCLTLD